MSDELKERGLAEFFLDGNMKRRHVSDLFPDATRIPPPIRLLYGESYGPDKEPLSIPEQIRQDFLEHNRIKREIEGLENLIRLDKMGANDLLKRVKRSKKEIKKLKKELNK